MTDGAAVPADGDSPVSSPNALDPAATGDPGAVGAPSVEDANAADAPAADAPLPDAAASDAPPPDGALSDPAAATADAGQSAQDQASTAAAGPPAAADAAAADGPVAAVVPDTVPLAVAPDAAPAVPDAPPAAPDAPPAVPDAPPAAPAPASPPGGNGVPPAPVPSAAATAAMVSRTPSRDRLLDCSVLDPLPPPDWRRRTIGTVALAAAGGAIALVFAIVRQSLPQADVALSETETGIVLLLMAALLLVVGIGAFGEGYLAGLWAVSPFSFGVAAAASVAAYLVAAEGSPGVPTDAVPTIFVGSAAAAIFTAGGGFVGRALAWRDRAQTGTYIRLRDRYLELCSRYSRLERAVEVPAYRADQYEMMLAEAYPRLVETRRELLGAEAAQPALRWLLATGYSNIERTLHRVEESILAAESDAALVGDALHDSLRLSGSTMADREALHDHLVAAVRVVSATSTQAFFTPLPAVDPAAQVTGAGAPSAVEAREVLREVRLAVNEFRDDRVDGLIRARQHLVWTALAAGGTTYLLLALALLRGVPKTQLTAAAAFYLVAALVGLFNRLRVEAGRSSAVEDYGLYVARLVTAPLVSGLAGVAGVYLIAKSPQFLSSLTTASQAPNLSAMDIFDVSKNEIGVLVAAVFGLAPAQLTSALQHQADRFEQDLEKSQPAGGSNLSEAGGGR